MKKILFLLSIVFSVSAAQIESSEQLIIAASTDWNSTSGLMYILEKEDGVWKQINIPWQINFGDSGMAWGIGVHSALQSARMKVEGDHRTPAGIFELGDFYGYDSLSPEGIKYPYHQGTKTLHCVDDTSSVFYNTLIDEQEVNRDSLGKLPWKSSEMMWMDSMDYKYVIRIKNNPRGISGAGSCLFLHLSRISAPLTLGCTSMEEDKMVFLMQWLDPDKHPLLMQLPLSEFKKYLVDWKLPVLTRN
jgi:L,D-peptidoglycan transpeptidase YkuD (ErfK/YbiS/YcfS/YnhG family)